MLLFDPVVESCFPLGLTICCRLYSFAGWLISINFNRPLWRSSEKAMNAFSDGLLSEPNIDSGTSEATLRRHGAPIVWSGRTARSTELARILLCLFDAPSGYKHCPNFQRHFTQTKCRAFRAVLTLARLPTSSM